MLVAKKLNLNKGEYVVNVIRSSPGAFIAPLLVVIIILAIPFFFYYLLQQWGSAGKYILAFFLVAGVFCLFRIFILWHFNAWVITNFKVVDFDQRRIFDRRVSEVPLEKIKDVSYRTVGFIPTLFRLSDVEILTHGGRLSFILPRVSRSHEILQLINKLKLKKIERQLLGTNLSTSELHEMLNKIKANLGEEKFKKLISAG